MLAPELRSFLCADCASAASAAFVCVLQCVSSMVCVLRFDMGYGSGWLPCYGINVASEAAHSKPTAARGENELACEIDSP